MEFGVVFLENGENIYKGTRLITLIKVDFMEYLSSKENNVLISGFLITLLLVGLAIAQESDEIEIDVSIASSTMIDVNPNTTSWASLAIGQTSSDAAFTIENIGSSAISNIDANVTNNASNPYGASDASAFDAGNFIIMNSSNISTSTLYYINKRDWNGSVPEYVTAPTGWEAGVSNGTFGRFKTAESGGGLDVFWFLNQTNADEYSWNCSNGTLYIANHPHTKEETGDVDFTDADKYTEFALSNYDNYGYANISMAGNVTDFYCAKVSADCQTIDWSHWNNALDPGSNCDTEVYVHSGGPLNPGQSLTIYLKARIPFGVAAGSAVTGTVSFTAS